MRNVSFGPAWSATKAILYANVAFFIIQQILLHYTSVPLVKYFYLSKEGIAHGFVFQLVTYQFLHGGLFHLFCNLLVIYFFGKALEEVLGAKDFLMLYFTGGVVGGIFQIGLAWGFPDTFYGSVVGASAAGFALVAAFAQMFPQRTITLLIFFVFPVSMRAQTLLWIAIGLAVFGIIVPTSNVAHGAHLGGIVVGLSYVHYVIKNSWRFTMPSFSRIASQKVGARITTKSWSGNARDAEEVGAAGGDFISKEIDPILEKISEHGIHSLTEKERAILESARSRMGRQ
ncbi:MAG: rhomboid family intramembrane serine protease [Verrucomicrobia bacterium]|nr:rhomboid family intramembrane serine protease [Verrucomicrobiota bacterium]